ncbi:hypothetical protein [Microbacterium suaedae]|uniref:hypothetical protein n=1 Tax=Microbacterium suaedae TaxID=2067813 RepID=UPI000DA199A6|nr:hypothetical protein [Microbacterium suaedae]
MTDRKAWIQRVERSRRARWFNIIGLAAYLLLIGVVAIGTLVTDDPIWAGTWIGVVSALVVGILAVLTQAFSVRVDRSGFTVRSVLGFPRVHVPRDDIAAVEVVDVGESRYLNRFGWHHRANGDRELILRTGEALTVTRTDGSCVTVAVEDAVTGAELLRR